MSSLPPSLAQAEATKERYYRIHSLYLDVKDEAYDARYDDKIRERLLRIKEDLNTVCQLAYEEQDLLFRRAREEMQITG